MVSLKAYVGGRYVISDAQFDRSLVGDKGKHCALGSVRFLPARRTSPVCTYLLHTPFMGDRICRLFSSICVSYFYYVGHSTKNASGLYMHRLGVGQTHNKYAEKLFVYRLSMASNDVDFFD
jgi:hypothetical protein